MALVNAQSPSGALGFPTPPGSVLSVEAVLGGETFGTHDHPFGDAVTDPDGDIRLALSSLIVADMESGLVFDFALTSSTIYAIYERVAFARPALGHYAAFVFGVPLARRARVDMHKLRISYDRDANVISWLIEDVEVFRVTEPGKWIDRTSMILDKGGQEQPAVMNQLCTGLGLVTILDGAIAGGPALVNLTGIPGDFDPAPGEPVAPTFVDNASKPGSRLFGQGARLDCHRFTIYRA